MIKMITSIINRLNNQLDIENDNIIINHNFKPSEVLKHSPRIKSTVYPTGGKQFSLDGRSEWYGLQEGKK
jgi:hypothetical protein